MNPVMMDHFDMKVYVMWCIFVSVGFSKNLKSENIIMMLILKYFH